MVEELKYYLGLLRGLIDKLPQDRAVYKEGTTVGQLEFHALQATSHMIRVRILEKEFARDRAAEFANIPTSEMIEKAFKDALESLDMLAAASDVDLNKDLSDPMVLVGTETRFTTKLQALIHANAHLGEHYGELNEVLREVEKGK